MFVKCPRAILIDRALYKYCIIIIIIITTNNDVLDGIYENGRNMICQFVKCT